MAQDNTTHSFWTCRHTSQLKDVERIGAKKGVISQAIKDVLQVMTQCAPAPAHHQQSPLLVAAESG